MTAHSRLIASNWLGQESQTDPTLANLLAPKIADLFAPSQKRVSMEHWEAITSPSPISSAPSANRTTPSK